MRAWARGKSSNLPVGALRDSTSLYLRDAADSPIRWQPWSEQSFELARTLNRPVLIDVGAVWCHWCHVMDQTTYADPDVIKLINEKYVPIKVDTDQRPDIDGYYQTAAAHLTGASGWPLTCITTSNGALMYATGYLPAHPKAARAEDSDSSAMVPLLARIADIYAQEQPQLEKQANALAVKLRYDASNGESTPGGWQEVRTKLLAQLKSEYDPKHGGFGASEGPRLYEFPAIRLALASGFFGHPEFTTLALDSLHKIAAGGVFDQLGGGFHRYSTDPEWNVPHFEKLGYDQAMALNAYADAYEQSHDEEFARVLRLLVQYVNASLLDRSHKAFYSHQDADAFKGDDGSYYTWTVAEMKKALAPQEAAAAFALFGVDNAPAHMADGRIILRRALTIDQLAAQLKISHDQAAQIANSATAHLLAARETRRTPPIDRAILTDRNALMAIGYINASAALGDKSLRDTALADLDFLLDHAQASDGTFYHEWSNGRANVQGLVSDQAFMLAALVEAGQVSTNPRYLKSAERLATQIDSVFRASGSSLLVNRDPAERGTVLASMIEDRSVLFDMPIPSVQAVAAMAMRKLGVIERNDAFTKKGDNLLNTAAGMAAASAGTALGTLGIALEQREHGDTLIAVLGDTNDTRSDALWQAALTTYRPGKIVIRLDAAQAKSGRLPAQAWTAFSESPASKGSTLAFVCTSNDCAHPASSGSELTDLIKSYGVESSSAVASTH